MNQGDYTVYTIKIDGFTKQNDQREASKTLERHEVLGGYQRITPVMKMTPGVINVPRLCTFYRIAAPEGHWQEMLRKAFPHIEITAEPWAPAPGYPMGDEPVKK